ncbi:adenylate/guanylate cyclase domain-containing protein [Streptomyces kanamyceticus]|uniref:Adenylate/guanylate cyclase domain-containing protein n=2 Tax=Bacteria TaxID=2 RepID=A0A5J6G8X6_STRKN|nr:adenylate/guanylate cyclase domain-containing protein [Streptomyces kanamyceticus]QEU90375.1 adenylate/guanylate cyclase domain-containing protein [Streptomyces kanamyceticus]
MTRDRSAQSRKTVTIVFCDMVGSTALSERLDAEALRHVMLRYYAVLSDCLERHGGTVEKYIGDAVMAVFGIPAIREDDALRAARAALDILAAVRTFAKDALGAHGVPVAVRIGIHTGEVVTSGDADAGHALVSGEVVNVAARLEQHAPTGQILVGADTQRLIASAAETVPVPPLTVKGKRDPVPAWRLVSVGSPGHGAARGRGVALVDRQDELAQLDLAFGRVGRDRTCHLVTLYGDPGVGKSRLARTFAAVAAAAGATVACAACPPYGSEGSLAPLAQLLKRLLGDGPRERLAELLGTAGPAAAAATALARLAGSGRSGTSFDETCWALQRLCTALAAERPLVLVIDDLQWAHEDLLGALDHIADWVQGAPLLVLCLARPELLEQHGSWGSGKLNATALVVPPLGGEDCRELVMRLSGGSAAPTTAEQQDVVAHFAPSPLPDRAVGRLISRSEGNPLFVEQIMEMVAEGADPDDVPLSVRAIVAARLDRLAPDERAVLERASVIGAEFAAADLAALAEPDEPAADPVVRDLARRRFLEAADPGTAGEPRWRLVSQLIRDEVYTGMSKLLRARGHESYAEHARRTGPDDHHTIGTHLEQASRLRAELDPGDPEVRRTARAAATHLGRAGTDALAHGDINWAVGLLRRALALTGDRSPDALALRTALAEARLAAGDAEEAVAEMRRLLGDAAEAGDARTAARVRLQLGYLEPGDDGFGTLRDAARAAVPVFTEADDALGLARAFLAMGQESQSRSRHREAAAHLERALRESVRAGAELERAGILGALAVSLWLGPEPVGSALRSCRGFRGDHLAGRLVGRATVACPMAVLLAMRGEFDEARGLLDDALRTLTDLGHHFAVPAVHLFTATVAQLADHWDEAERLLRDAAAATERLGDGQLHSTAVRDLARVLLSRGDPRDEVRALLDRLIGDGVAAMPAAACEVHGMRARIAAADGDHAAAAEHIVTALRAAAATDSPSCRAGAELDRAHVARALGRTTEAAAAAAEAERLFRAKGHLVGVRRAAAVRDGGR